LNCIKSNL